MTSTTSPSASSIPSSDELHAAVTWQTVIADNWNRYAVTGVAVTAIIVGVGVITSSLLALAPVSLLFTATAIVWHAVLSARISTAEQLLTEAKELLASEASSNRILGGIRVLRGSNTLSRDARLASAVRMATEYPAAVVFNLREAHGVLSPSNWSYDGQLGHIRDSFEPVDGADPGATAARQGSAIVISENTDEAMALPVWAEKTGFRQGIVAPITKGLDTVGVVYVLNKSEALPTLNEIEQLELMISFSSLDGIVPGVTTAAAQNQPFRVIENGAPTSSLATTTSAIRMSGFALNPESERLEMDGNLISLSPTEFLLMHTLASSPEKPVSAVELMDRCWSKDSRPADNAVDVAIFRLRKKLNKSASGKGLIKTVRGSGYMFIPPSGESSPAVVAD